jgi:hypothetical protein
MKYILKLSPPWITFLREVEAIFKKDPEVNVTYDNETDQIKIFVDDQDKADAISKIILPVKDFGNVKVKISVIPANKPNNSNIIKNSNVSLFKRAFKNNDILSYTTEDQKGLFTMSYIVFKPEIVQFFNDDLTDINGLASMLYNQIAYDIFRPELNVSYCIDKIDS